MKQIYFATTNQGKVQRLREALDPIGFRVLQAPMEIPEPRSANLREIAAAKVRYAYERLEQPVAALDSGFYLDCFPGFPGT